MTTNPPARRKRILVLTSTFPRWEGDREPPFVFELSRRLLQHFDVSVLAPHAPGAKLTETMEGIAVHRFRYCFTPWQRLAYDGGILANLKKSRLNYLLIPFLMLSEFMSLHSLMRRSQVDLIHAHWLIPQGLVALAACAFSRQRPIIVCTSHGGDLFGLSGALLTRIKQLIIRKIDHLTVVSHAMRDYAKTLVTRADIDVISMGVDLHQRFTPSTTNSRKEQSLLYAGRLVEKKGVRYLISAMPKILQHHPHAELIVAGDGPDRADLEQLATTEGVATQVHFIGAVDNAALRDLYRQATVFIAPSIVARGGDQEGLGLVLVEALGCECAVVASDLPAIEDVIVNGVTGLVARQKDSNDLAEKITTLLADPALGATLGRAGRTYVLERFDWNLIAARYAKLFDGLTANTSRASGKFPSAE